MPCGRQEAFGRQLNAFRSAKRAPSNKPATTALIAKSSENIPGQRPARAGERGMCVSPIRSVRPRIH